MKDHDSIMEQALAMLRRIDNYLAGHIHNMFFYRNLCATHNYRCPWDQWNKDFDTWMHRRERIIQWLADRGLTLD